MPQSEKHAREYETIYILRPDVDSEAAEKVQQRVYEVVARENGQMMKLESWGRRKLAYPVAKHRTGVYFYARFIGKGGLVQELERNLKVIDSVMKYQTVLLTDDVVIESLTIDAEEAKIQKIELPAFVAEEELRERVLGLITDEPRHDRHHRDEERHESGGEHAEAASQSEAAAEGAAEKAEAKGEPKGDPKDEAKVAPAKAETGSAKPDDSN